MSLKEAFLIRRYFKKHPYGEDGYDLFNLFKSYAEKRVTTTIDVANAAVSFVDLINKTTEDLHFPSREALLKFGKDRGVLFTDLTRVSPFMPTWQKEYCHVVKTLSPNVVENSHILDVGAGRVIPHSSIEFSKDFKTVTCMDKLRLSNKTLQKFGVNGEDNYFDKDTSIENYDFITGKTPCGAIDSIVEVCSKNNKPYFIETCDCKLKPGQTWKDILPEIDPNVKFYRDYAFNIDATEDQVAHICEDYYLSTNRCISPNIVKIVNSDCSENEWLEDPTPNNVQE